MIGHIVLFNPKAGLAESSLLSFGLSIQKAFSAIPTVKRALIGRRLSIDAGYERSLGHKTYEFTAILEFENEAALIAYLRHPLHAELGRLFWDYCESTVISEVRLVDGKDPEAVMSLVK